MDFLLKVTVVPGEPHEGGDGPVRLPSPAEVADAAFTSLHAFAGTVLQVPWAVAGVSVAEAGPLAPQPEVIGEFTGPHRFLSNFFPCQVATGRYFPGARTVTWRSAEHAYQAAKSDDPAYLALMEGQATPREAKRAGRAVTLRPGWDLARKGVMFAVVFAKFTQNRDLASFLDKTGDAVLSEGNDWHDNYWGDCRCPRCAAVPGKNHLGKALMFVRELLRES